MRIILLIIFLSLQTYLSAQIPEYYQNIDFTASPENIELQLRRLVRNTHLYQLNYTPQTWEALKETDLDPNNSENVLLMYGYNNQDDLTYNDRSRDKDWTCHQEECEERWNREHVYPKSIGNFEQDSWPGSDVHSLRACDSQMNSLRYNYPFIDGEGNSGLRGNFRFYPGDEWKGDVARMIMYMYLRYPTQCLPNYVGDSPNSYHNNIPDIFLIWNAEDPVSDYEMNRNNIVHDSYQGNRNPFIDNPYLANKIWGGPSANNTWEALNVNEVNTTNWKLAPNPTSNYVNHHDDYEFIGVYDMNGRLVTTDNNLTDHKIYLPIENELYLIKVCQENICKTFKVLKK